MKNLPREEIPLFLRVFLNVRARQFVMQLEALDRGEDFQIEPEKYNREFVSFFIEEARIQNLIMRK